MSATMVEPNQANALAARGLRPVTELARDRPHGDRLRYLAGCKCSECRRANSAYERSRIEARKAGDWNGIVPADAARAHLVALSHQQVGRRTVADASGVAETVLQDIKSGRKTRIRARTERAILATTKEAAADHALVDAGLTWLLLDALLADGYSKAELARSLGCSTPSLQLPRTQVTVRNAFDVVKLHQRLQKCDARSTTALLKDLSEEGFHRSRIERELLELAATTGRPAPDLRVRKGRILLSTAVLVGEPHTRLTAEP